MRTRLHFGQVYVVEGKMAQNAVKRARRIAQGEHNGYFISSAVVHELGYYYKTRIIVILGIYIACDDIKAVQLCRGFGTYRRLGLISAPRNVRRRLGGVAEGNCGYVGSVGKVFGTLAYALRMRIYLPDIALLCTAHARKMLAYALPAFGGYEKVVFAEQVVYVAYRTRGRIFYRNHSETYLSRFQLSNTSRKVGQDTRFPASGKNFSHARSEWEPLSPKKPTTAFPSIFPRGYTASEENSTLF